MKYLNFYCKAVITAVLSCAVCMGISGCGESGGRKNGETALTQQQEEDTGSADLSYDEVDIDLSEMSKTMVYSEVSHMLQKPEQYIGKVVKMKGPVAVYGLKDENGESYYDFAVIIEDATACCQRGMEFVLEGVEKTPEAYPDKNTQVCVVGVFNTYEAGKYTYCHVEDAILLS